MNKATCRMLMLGVLLATGAAAVAADASAPPRVAVKVGDLNLGSEAGRQELDRRLMRAARKVCPDIYSRSVQTRMAGTACVNRAVEQALGQVEQRRLAGAPALRRERS